MHSVAVRASARWHHGLGAVRHVDGGTIVAVATLAVVVGMAVFAGVVSPHDPIEQDLARRFEPPMWVANGEPSHPIGTDALGRDLLSRIIHGSRVSLAVGAVTVVVQGGIGVALGLVAGYFGGKVDLIVMRAVDIQLTIPFLVLAIVVIGALGPSLVNTILVLGVTGWVVYARLVRAEILSVRERDFVVAARAVGCQADRILVRHLLPSASPSVVVIATLQVGRMITAEAFLSFLGLGVLPPTPTWGGMVADGRNYVASAWWVSTFPGLAIFCTVLAVNLLGDRLRDALNPTLQT